jgi:hypothetical protein
MLQIKTPYMCPVCNGRGLVPAGFYEGEVASTDHAWHDACRACENGVIWRAIDSQNELGEVVLTSSKGMRK